MLGRLVRGVLGGGRRSTVGAGHSGTRSGMGGGMGGGLGGGLLRRFLRG